MSRNKLTLKREFFTYGEFYSNLLLTTIIAYCLKWQFGVIFVDGQINLFVLICPEDIIVFQYGGTIVDVHNEYPDYSKTC